MEKRTLGVMATIFGLILVSYIGFGVKAWGEYESQYGYNWTMAVNSSTLDKKSYYVDKYIQTIEESGEFNGKSAAILVKTPAEAYENNLASLKDLQSRLKEIKSVDIKSFEYQTAIQQITEQIITNENRNTLNIQHMWFINHYFLLSDWLCFFGVIISAILFVVFFICYKIEDY